MLYVGAVLVNSEVILINVINVVTYALVITVAETAIAPSARVSSGKPG
jgi:hypothetical protein